MYRIKSIFFLLMLISVAYGETSGNAQAGDPPALPLRIDGTRQLFVDDMLIDRMQNCRRVIHQGKKNNRYPLLEDPGDKPAMAGTVFLENGIWRLWYSANMPDVGFVGCYATSRDGISWDKPALGIVQQPPGNNIFLPLPRDAQGKRLTTVWYHPAVFRDDRTEIAEERYKMGIWGSGGLYSAFSTDGIHWRFHDKRSGFAWVRDVIAPCWDPIQKRYLIYCQINQVSADYRGRTAGMAWSKDFRKWHSAGIVLRPDSRDPAGMQIHGMAVFWYENMFLGLPQMFHTTPPQAVFTRKEVAKMHIQLASSRDGVTWRRSEPRTQLIPFGSAEKGDFDAGFMITTQGPIRVGDELRLYYFAMSRPQYTKGLATFPEDVQEKVNRVPLKRGLGMVTWRLDGFASISAKTTPGRVVTKPLVAAGEELVVNADASRGRILVEVLDENNRPLKGLSAQDCEPLVSDAVRQVVRFGGQSGFLKQLAGKTIRLRFSLENADLYSFQFRHSPTIDTGRK